MKLNELKKVIKDSVKEAIQEELKEILLEAVKGGSSPKTTVVSEDSRKKYANALNEATLNFTSNDVAKIGAMSGGYQVPPGINTAGEGSTLPAGEVDLSQISSLMNSK